MGGPAIIVQRISCYERRRRRHCFHCRNGGIFAAQEGDDTERTQEHGGIGRGRGRRWVEDAMENKDDGEEEENKEGRRGRRMRGRKRSTIRSLPRTPVTRGRGFDTKSANWPTVGPGHSQCRLGMGFWGQEEHEAAYSWLPTPQMFPGSSVMGTRRAQSGVQLAPDIQNVAWELCSGTTKATKWPTVGSGHAKCGLGMAFWQEVS